MSKTGHKSKTYFRDIHFSKTTSPQQVIFKGKLSTIIIFKHVNRWTLCFVLKKSTEIVQVPALCETSFVLTSTLCKYRYKKLTAGVITVGYIL